LFTGACIVKAVKGRVFPELREVGRCKCPFRNAHTFIITKRTGTQIRTWVAAERGGGLPCCSLAALRSVRWAVLRRPPLASPPEWPWTPLHPIGKNGLHGFPCFLGMAQTLSRRLTRSRLLDRSPAPLRVHGRRSSPSAGWKYPPDEARRLRLWFQRERPRAHDRPAGSATSDPARAGTRRTTIPPTSSFPDSVPLSYR
jgi:hypothetical protein